MNLCVKCRAEFVPSSKGTQGRLQKYCSQTCYHSVPKQNLALAQRFWPFVKKTDTCWLWTGSDDGRKRYGRIKHNQKNIGTHRASWELHNGPIPKGMQVCHHCDNPPCVRPDHLFLGTVLDNARDCHQKRRKFGLGGAKGQNHGMSRLTDADVLSIRAAYAAGQKPRQIAETFGIHRDWAYRLATGMAWKHIQSTP